MTSARHAALLVVFALLGCGGDPFEAEGATTELGQVANAAATGGGPNDEVLLAGRGPTAAPTTEPTGPLPEGPVCPNLRNELIRSVASAVTLLDADRCTAPEQCRAFAVQSGCGTLCGVIVNESSVKAVQEAVGPWLSERCSAECTAPTDPCTTAPLRVTCANGRCLTL